MRTLIRPVICLALLGAGCSSNRGTGIPTAPDRLPSQAPAPVPPPAPFAERFTPITLGQIVSSRVSADDPACDAWHCQYFQLTAPSDGTLEVRVTYSKGNLDVSVNDSQGIQWWDPSPVLGRPTVIIAVKAGSTYQIAVWEYEFPGVEFELRTSLTPN